MLVTSIFSFSQIVFKKGFFLKSRQMSGMSGKELKHFFFSNSLTHAYLHFVYMIIGKKIRRKKMIYKFRCLKTTFPCHRKHFGKQEQLPAFPSFLTMFLKRFFLDVVKSRERTLNTFCNVFNRRNTLIWVKQDACTEQ